MRDASIPPRREGFTCPVCQCRIVTSVEGIFRNRKAGSDRRFCDPACRQAAYRRRRAGAPEDTPRQLKGGRNRALNHPITADKEDPNTTPQP